MLNEKFKPSKQLHLQNENPSTSTISNVRQNSLSIILHPKIGKLLYLHLQVLCGPKPLEILQE
jgi:hypothetical protein